MTHKRQIAIIGAGHNSLVCACYLTKARHDVAVYERRLRVGGAVNTEELWPGYNERQGPAEEEGYTETRRSCRRSALSIAAPAAVLSKMHQAAPVCAATFNFAARASSAASP